MLGKLGSEVLDIPQLHSVVNTAETEISEIIYDVIKLLHHHPSLQFPLKASSTDGGELEDEIDPDAAENSRKNITRQKLHEMRLVLIVKVIFPVLYELLDTLRAHKSAAQLVLLKLMKQWLNDVPDLVGSDPKFKVCSFDIIFLNSK
jgi:hypothetical protein